ncbi:IS3 family transposase [Turicibacter bilis]
MGVIKMKHGLLEEFGLIVNYKYIRRIMHKYRLVCKIRKARFKHAK